MLRLRTILHPTDFSLPAERAFQVACSLARDAEALIVILHVAVPPVVGYGSAMAPPPQGDWKAMEDRLYGIEPPDPTIRVQYRLETGTPTGEIVRVAKATEADLIVMGSHGRTGLARLLMGSVAEHVVREAPCAVLIIKDSKLE